MCNYKLSIENGIITDIEMYRVNEPSPDGSLQELQKIEANLFIPKEVVGFSEDPEFLESLKYFDPIAIEVEEGNEVFESKGNCLIRKEDKKILLGSRYSIIPEDGSVEDIGDCVFNLPSELYKMNLNNLKIPDGIRSIGYRAFARYIDEDVYITVSDSVERIDSMAFMMNMSEDASLLITFFGSPELEPGVFGTKAEAVDSRNELYRDMPDKLYVDPENIMVQGLKNSSVEKYCKKYGIPFELLNEFYESTIWDIFANRDINIDFSEDFYKEFDEVLSQLRPDEIQVIKDVYLKRTLYRALRKLRNPVRSKRLYHFIQCHKDVDEA